MRLLELSPDNQLSLASYDEDDLPPYAILSHTWGTDNEEVIYEDIVNGTGKSKAGYAKILFCGKQAHKDDLKHFWVDTCCIKKSSDAELSEALNSMFRWYKEAKKCYVHLKDVATRELDGQLSDWKSDFEKSRWFTRGWTLQELLAPKAVEFWSLDGHFLGTKDTLNEAISTITGIPLSAVSGRLALTDFSPDERLRWAQNRETKRKEDRAYCLLGLFGIFLPPIYGEGDNAFARLNSEIERLSQQLQPTSAFSRVNNHSSSNVPPSKRPMRYQLRRREDLMSLLNLYQIDEIKGPRESYIEPGAPQTCEWLLQNPDYLHWNVRDEQSRGQDVVFWITGKPGSGKSTIMVYALEQARRTKPQDEIIISFFFHARGYDLEKSTIGMYRSLLFQLLTEAPDLQAILDRIDVAGLNPWSSVAWTCNALESLLHAALESLGPRSLRCFIDALDECDEQQVRLMIEFFEDCGKGILCDESRLYVCFASRFYSCIDIPDARKLVLEDQSGHREDIAFYIQQNLSLRGDIDEVEVREVRDQVRERSESVFAWVRLVVRHLNIMSHQGYPIGWVRHKLQEFPRNLSELDGSR